MLKDLVEKIFRPRLPVLQMIEEFLLRAILQADRKLKSPSEPAPDLLKRLFVPNPQLQVARPTGCYLRKRFLTRTNSSARSTGLLRKSSAPALLASILAPLSCRLLIMMIGMFLVARLPLILAATW